MTPEDYAVDPGEPLERRPAHPATVPAVVLACLAAWVVYKAAGGDNSD